MFGRVLLFPLLRLAGYGATITASFVVSAVAYFLFGQSVTAALAAAWLTLAAGGSGLVVLLAYVFDRFDVAHGVAA